jgi:hypothetical protein
MKTVGDERGFDWFASVHGLALPFWCEHGTPLFLPWHRAYLYYFELAMQTRLGPRFTPIAPQDPELAEVGLPWWDWTSDESHREGIPDAYAQDEIDGQPNPLAASTIGSCIGGEALSTGVWSAPLVNAVRQQVPGSITDDGPPRTVRDPDEPDELPRAATLDDIVLQQNTFDTFTTSLEQVHNDVHVWVGGSMTLVPTSALRSDHLVAPCHDRSDLVSVADQRPRHGSAAGYDGHRAGAVSDDRGPDRRCRAARLRLCRRADSLRGERWRRAGRRGDPGPPGARARSCTAIWHSIPVRRRRPRSSARTSCSKR